MYYVKTKKQKKSSNMEKENKSDTSLTTIMVDRRGVLSSPVLLCNESHSKQTKKKNKKGKMETIQSRFNAPLTSTSH